MYHGHFADEFFVSWRRPEAEAYKGQDIFFFQETSTERQHAGHQLYIFSKMASTNDKECFRFSGRMTPVV